MSKIDGRWRGEEVVWEDERGGGRREKEGEREKDIPSWNGIVATKNHSNTVVKVVLIWQVVYIWTTIQKNKTKQNKTKQNKTKQNKTKQNKTKQNKTKQNKIKQNM
jgi:hypothetical protein